jgi:curli production assembly/transport component CsgG
MLKYKNEEADVTAIYGRLTDRRSKFAIEFSGGLTLMDGDRVDPLLRPMVRGALKYFLTPGFNLSASTNVIKLANKGYSEKDMQFDLNAEYIYCQKINSLYFVVVLV